LNFSLRAERERQVIGGGGVGRVDTQQLGKLGYGLVLIPLQGKDDSELQARPCVGRLTFQQIGQLANSFLVLALFSQRAGESAPDLVQTGVLGER